MTENDIDLQAYRLFRESAGIYRRGARILAVDGIGRFDFLAHLLARSTEYVQPGSVFDSLILEDDGRVRTLVTVIWEEDRVYLLDDVGTGLTELCRQVIAERGFADVSVDETDRLAAIAIEGPLAWRVAETLIDSDISSLLLGAHVQVTLPGNGSPAIVARTGSTGEFGYLVLAFSLAPEVLEAQLLELAAPVSGGLVTRAALSRAQAEVHHPLLPQQAAGISVREASLTWLTSPARTDEFRGRSGLDLGGEPSRVLITVLADQGALADAGTPVYAGDRQVGQLQVVVPTCGQQQDLGLALLDQPFAVPGLDLTIDDRKVRTVSCPVLAPASWSRPIGG